jgi:heme A synthase
MSPVAGGRKVSKGFRRTAVAALVSTYLLIVAGGVVRVSGSGLGCGVQGQDWPLCHGHLVPPADPQTLIEFSHRMLATISTVLVVLLAVWAWRSYRHLPRVVKTTSVVVGLLLVQIILGGATVELKLPGGVVLAHLANALLLLGVLIAAAVAIHRPSGDMPSLSDAQRRAARQMAWAAGATYALVLSGGVVVANGAGYACSGWPLCGSGFEIDSSHSATINLFHRLVAGVVAVFLGWSIARVIRAFKGVRPVRITAMAVNVVLLLQIVAGAVVVETRLPGYARGIHLALASLLWASAALLALLTRPAALREVDRATAGIGARREAVPS